MNFYTYTNYLYDCVRICAVCTLNCILYKRTRLLLYRRAVTHNICYAFILQYLQRLFLFHSLARGFWKNLDLTDVL